MNRRDALGSIAATGLLTAMSEPTNAANHVPDIDVHPAVKGPRMNFDQADKIMTQLGLDALVLGAGNNFQYATGLLPVVSRMGYEPSTLAIVARRDKDRLATVMAAFTYYYTLSESHRGSDIPVYIYTSPINGLKEGEQAATPLTLFKDRGESRVDIIEQSRVTATELAYSKYGQHATLEQGLAKALADMGMTKARIAVDHPAAKAAVAQAAPAASIVDADDALRRIRPIKSATEIQLMRQAATGNVAATREALETVRAGGSYRDLRAAFFTAAARRGHRGVFMVVDRVSDELYDDTFKEGQGFLIDSVSEYQGYHGDYGRTVVVGEPDKSLKQATQAMTDAWDKVRGKLRPGLKFSDIRQMGQDALRQAGKRYIVPFNPHSVGMYHTDHVGETGLPMREDMIVEPGMILSIDCPLLETGVGGSAHLEDLMLITPDGSEPIHDTSDPVIQV